MNSYHRQSIKDGNYIVEHVVITTVTQIAITDAPQDLEFNLAAICAYGLITLRSSNNLLFDVVTIQSDGVPKTIAVNDDKSIAYNLESLRLKIPYKTMTSFHHVYMYFNEGRHSIPVIDDGERMYIKIYNTANEGKYTLYKHHVTVE